jgi:hypothetical protein
METMRGVSGLRGATGASPLALSAGGGGGAAATVGGVSTRGLGGGGGGAARLGAAAFGRSMAARGAAFAEEPLESSPALTGEGRDFNPRR